MLGRRQEQLLQHARRVLGVRRQRRLELPAFGQRHRLDQQRRFLAAPNLGWESCLINAQRRQLT